MMRSYIRNPFLWLSMLVLAGLPLLFYGLGEFPRRSLLKETLSILTILTFFQMIGQFFWTRGARKAVVKLTTGKVLKYHKFIGYAFILFLLLHPVFVVAPRLLEASVSPVDAFVTIITTLKQGVVLGIIAWCLLLVLGVTSLVRERLPMKYRTWRLVHGILAALFLVVAAWHVIDLGRHAGLAMSILASALTAGGILVLLKNYFPGASRELTEA